jgi:hypothetical protein
LFPARQRRCKDGVGGKDMDRHPKLMQLGNKRQPKAIALCEADVRARLKEETF